MNRIYVACLAAYNNAKLHGKWIDVDGKALDEVREEIAEVLKSSPEPDAEEWAIHDYEGFEGIKVSEYHNLETLVNYAEVLSNTNHDIELVTGVMDNLGCDIEKAIEYIDDNYAGKYKDLEWWAEELLNETGELDKLPRHLSYYFDYASYARDEELNGSIFTIESKNGVHVLWSR